jgi:hypothetical protein
MYFILKTKYTLSLKFVPAQVRGNNHWSTSQVRANILNYRTLLVVQNQIIHKRIYGSTAGKPCRIQLTNVASHALRLSLDLTIRNTTTMNVNQNYRLTLLVKIWQVTPTGRIETDKNTTPRDAIQNISWGTVWLGTKSSSNANVTSYAETTSYQIIKRSRNTHRISGMARIHPLPKVESIQNRAKRSSWYLNWW